MDSQTMTYENIHDQLLAGNRPATQAEAEDQIAVMLRYSKRAPQMIAQLLAESWLHHGPKGWIRHTREKFDFKDEKTLFRRLAAGLMLLDLLTADSAIHRRALAIEVTKLEIVSAIHHAKGHGVGSVINFLRLHYTEEMSREELRAARDAFLDKQKSADDGQLTFRFDLFGGAMAETTVEGLVTSDRFDGQAAAAMLHNGAMLCRGPVPWMLNHADQFDRDDLPHLEKIARDLEASSRSMRELLAMITDKHLRG